MQTESTVSYQRDLGNGLIARWSTADDTENIAQLVSHVFREKAEDPPNEHMRQAVRRHMRGDYPLMGPDDYAVVEDTRKEGNPIIACTCLWRHTWEYEGIPFKVGRPEFVASDPAYRKQGLIRALFQILHARSEAEGHMVQAITGIPYFYRQFGYEYALDLDGKRGVPLAFIPKAKEGEPEAFTLREATVEDIPLITECYNHRRTSSIVWAQAPEQYWHYQIDAWKNNPEHDKTSCIWMIIDTSGAAQGFVASSARRWGRELGIWAMDVAPGTNLHAVMPPLLRALRAHGELLPTRSPDTDPFGEISFYLGRSHPVYDVLGKTLAPSWERPYAWYVRVPDVAAFLKHITPALEKRLVNSPVEGYSGELKFDFYRGGLCMVFERGHLTTVERWHLPIYDSNANTGCPELVFLQLLFGHRSLDELRSAFPDVWVSGNIEVVLKTLFPSRPSFTCPLY